MFNDPDVVYKTRLTEYKPGLFNDSLSKENKNLVKDLNKKYGGKNRLNYYKQGGITSMTGTKYKVKSAETHGKKRSYNDPRKKKEYQHIHTTTRYYVY